MKRASFLNSEQHIVTGIISGGEVTQASETTVAVAEGTGVFINNTSIPITTKEINWETLSDIEIPNLISESFTYIMINDAGEIVLLHETPTSTHKRNLIQVGVASHPGSTIDFVSNVAVVSHDMLNIASDLASLKTPTVISGAHLSSSSGLTIDIATSKIFGTGINYRNDKSNPNIISTSELLQPLIYQVTQDGTRTSGPGPTVDVSSYDNNNVVTPLAGEAAIHYVFMSVTGVVEILYGQTAYSTITEAYESISADASTIILPSRFDLYVQVGFIIASSSTTVLSDDAQCIIIDNVVADHHHHGNKASLDKIEITSMSDDDMLVAQSGKLVNVPAPNTRSVKMYNDPDSADISADDVSVYQCLVITNTGIQVAIVLPEPSAASKIRTLAIVNNVNSVNHIQVNDVIIEQGSMHEFTWNGSAWVQLYDKSTYDGVLSTSWMFGGELTVNGTNPATFDISAGVGIYVDNFTSSTKPEKHIVVFGPTVGVPITNITTQPFTRIAIDKHGDVVQIFSITRELVRDVFILGEVQHESGTAISNISEFTSVPSVGIASSLFDLASVIGDINIYGNEFKPNGNNLKIDKTIGEVFTLWFNAKSNIKDPSKISHAAQTQTSFVYTYRNGTGGFVVDPGKTDIIATRYDDGTPSIGPIPNGVVLNNRYQIQRVYLGQSSTVIIQYGQALYTTIESAELGISTEEFARNPALDDVLLRGWIIVKGSATNLSDPLQARFIEADKFGSTSTVDAGAGAGLSGWKDNIQDFAAARGNGTTEPLWQNMGNGQYAYHFTPNDELFVKFHVTHDYKIGTKAYPHVHFLVDTTMTAGQTVVWSFNYVKAKGHAQGQSLSTPAETVIVMTYTATGTEVAGEHIILECNDASAFDLIEPDTIISARVKLNSTNVSGRVFGLLCDLHYQVDRLATVNKKPNFYG